MFDESGFGWLLGIEDTSIYPAGAGGELDNIC
jgi:hypothetical protein